MRVEVNRGGKKVRGTCHGTDMGYAVNGDRINWYLVEFDDQETTGECHRVCPGNIRELNALERMAEIEQ
jgi:hypothetical protein